MASTALVASTTSEVPKQVVVMTKAAALSGWPSTESSDSDSAPTALPALTASSTQPKFVDNSFCAFCLGASSTRTKPVGACELCAAVGRGVRVGGRHGAEIPVGKEPKPFAAVRRVRGARRERWLTLSRCQRHYHFSCAYDYGVVFLPNGETIRANLTTSRLCRAKRS